MSELSKLNEAKAKVAELEALVKKQASVMVQARQKLVDVELRNKKNQAAQNINQQPALDLTDYVNNDDIVQLVTELQTQLDALEARTMRRTYNATVQGDDEKLAPITNKDGDLPDFALPVTLKEFKLLEKIDLTRLGVFYEIILPDGEEIDHALQQTNSKEAILDINKKKDIIELSKNFDEDQANEIYDELARYFGIKHRRNSDGW